MVPTVERGLLRGRLLLDGDGRRQAADDVVVRLLHLPEELAGVGGEALDVAALPLGVEGVEGQRALAADPETPVKTTSFFLGISSVTSLRLCSRAPLTTMDSGSMGSWGRLGPAQDKRRTGAGQGGYRLTPGVRHIAARPAARHRAGGRRPEPKIICYPGGGASADRRGAALDAARRRRHRQREPAWPVPEHFVRRRSLRASAPPHRDPARSRAMRCTTRPVASTKALIPVAVARKSHRRCSMLRTAASMRCCSCSCPVPYQESLVRLTIAWARPSP